MPERAGWRKFRRNWAKKSDAACWASAATWSNWPAASKPSIRAANWLRAASRRTNCNWPFRAALGVNCKNCASPGGPGATGSPASVPAGCWRSAANCSRAGNAAWGSRRTCAWKILRQRTASLIARLRLLGPEQVLARGYSITRDAATGRILRAAAETAPGQKLATRLKAGEVTSTVTAVAAVYDRR